MTNQRPKLTEEIYKARIATLEEQVETLKETLEEEAWKSNTLISKLTYRLTRRNRVEWLKLFLLVLAAVIVGLCVWSGVGYAISHLPSVL